MVTDGPGNLGRGHNWTLYKKEQCRESLHVLAALLPMSRDGTDYESTKLCASALLLRVWVNEYLPHLASLWSWNDKLSL